MYVDNQIEWNKNTHLGKSFISKKPQMQKLILNTETSPDHKIIEETSQQPLNLITNKENNGQTTMNVNPNNQQNDHHFNIPKTQNENQFNKIEGEDPQKVKMDPSEKQPNHPPKQSAKQFLFKETQGVEGIFQRADWSPCGDFFIAPSASISIEGNGIKADGAYLFWREDFKKPILFYQTKEQVLLARFSSCIYQQKGGSFERAKEVNRPRREKIELAKIKEEKEKFGPKIVRKGPKVIEIKDSEEVLEIKQQKNSEMCLNNGQSGAIIEEENETELDCEGFKTSSNFDLGYNLAFILGCYNSLDVYSTSSQSPLFRLENIHYAGISDIAWHPSGNNLCVSSMDGFITFCGFSSGVLGKTYSLSETSQILGQNAFLKAKLEGQQRKMTKNRNIPQPAKIIKINKALFTRKKKRPNMNIQISNSKKIELNIEESGSQGLKEETRNSKTEIEIIKIIEE